MPSGALYTPAPTRMPRHRGNRPTLALLLVDWWLRRLMPYLVPDRPGPVLVCPQCLAEPQQVRRGDDGRLPCYLCGRIPHGTHAPISGRPFRTEVTA